MLARDLLSLENKQRNALISLFRIAGGGHPIGQRLEKEEEIGERLFGVTTVYSSLERLDEFGLLEESMKSGVPIVLSRYIDQGGYRL